MRSHFLIALLALALAAGAAGAPCHEIGTWQRVADAPSRVTEAACAQVGSILHTLVGFDDYAGGGLRATDAHWALDLDTGAWSQKAAVPYPGSHTQATDNSTHIFVAGAFVGDYPGNATDRVYAYSVADDQWTELPSLPRPSASAGFVFVREFNTLYYFSGLVDFEKSSDAVHTLDLSSSNAKWATLSTPFPDPRNHFLAKLVRPNLVVMPGGQHFNTNPDPIDLATVIGFNPENGTFYTLPPMPAERSHSDSVVSTGRLIVMGGRNNQAAAQIHNTILEYSPDDNAWFTLGSMPGQRLSPCVALHTNASGAWLWMTKGGVDWNVEVAETWVAKVDIKCNYTEPTLPPTAAPTTAAPVATVSPSTSPVSTQAPLAPPPQPSPPPPPPSVETLPPAPTANRGATTASLIPPLGSASLRLGASVAMLAAVLCVSLL